MMFRYYRYWCVFVAVLVAALLPQRSYCQAQAAVSELRPIDGSNAILQSFDSHPIVAIADLPGCTELHEFVRELIRNPRFSEKVNTIVVDFGNPLYQPVMDRYILDGELVPREVLRHVWDDTTESPYLTWDSEVYEQFFDTVRGVNQGLAREKRIRVILADAPIVWRHVGTRQEWLDWRGQKRENTLADKISQILKAHSQALVIAGASHLYRSSSASKNARMLVEDGYPGQFMTILPQGRFGGGDSYKTIEAREENIPLRSVVAVKDTWLGAIPVDADPKSMRLQDAVEAVLVLDDSGQLTRLQAAGFLFQNEEFLNEIGRRWKTVNSEPFDLQKAGFELRGNIDAVSLPIADAPPKNNPAPQRKKVEPVSPAPTDLHPTDGVDFVLKKLDEFPIVGLGDNHMCLEFHQFVGKLIRDPRLPGKINEIIVEFGNPKYQSIVDRYVVNGEAIPFDERKKVWQEAAMGWYVANSPIYAEFFDAVREVNIRLPKEKRIRVVLGDALMDLQQFLANPEQYLGQLGAHRETAQDPREISFTASATQVLAEHHRAIMIVGNGHLRAANGRENARTAIEKIYPNQFFLIDGNGPEHPSWLPGSIVTTPDDREPHHATLYVGTWNSLTGVRPSPLIYRDMEYWKTINLVDELTRRRTPVDLANPIFEYRSRYFEHP